MIHCLHLIIIIKITYTDKTEREEQRIDIDQVSIRLASIPFIVVIWFVHLFSAKTFRSSGLFLSCLKHLILNVVYFVYPISYLKERCLIL